MILCSYPIIRNIGTGVRRYNKYIHMLTWLGIPEPGQTHGHVSLIPRRYITMLTGYLDNSVYKEVVYDIVTATYLYRSVDFPNNTRYPASSVLPFQLNGPL